MRIGHESAKRSPEVILYGSMVMGLAGFADSIANSRYGIDLGIRNFLPEPLDLPDHGMSMAMGAVLANHSYSHRMREKGTSRDFDSIVDNTLTPNVRHTNVSDLRLRVAGAVFGGIVAASTYITIGEVGSEVLHKIHNDRQEEVPASERKPLPLGHFDPFDMLYGIGAGAAVVKLKGRRVTDWLDEVELLIPPATPKDRETAAIPTVRKQHPAQSKRYTPPKKRR